jgi:mannan endo-1,4-beta-mannosidase
LLVVATLGVIATATVAVARPDHTVKLPRTQGLAQAKIYWGAWIEGSQYGYANPPWDMRAVTAFEHQVGKPVSVLHFGQPWSTSGALQPFFPAPFEHVRQHGAIPLVDWASWDSQKGGTPSQPAFALSRIIDGAYDAYITAWARGARAWGHPFFLRFDHEMNGDWFPWSEAENGNRPGQFVEAWRHVHDLFVKAGATNVTWVWSPNVLYDESIPIAALYPGDAYVDWVAMDGYNGGANAAQPTAWRPFASIFRTTYRAMAQIAPTKPMMIAETASTELRGSKAAWITRALRILPADFPRIRALLWFDWNVDSQDWSVSSSQASIGAFAAGIASPYFAANSFGKIASSPIRPLSTQARTG